MQSPPPPKRRRLLRRKEVLERLRIKRTALDQAIERGDFPPSTTIFEGGRATVWDEEVVDTYIEQRLAASKKRRASK